MFVGSAVINLGTVARMPPGVNIRLSKYAIHES
jgi:hypothetical protein